MRFRLSSTLQRSKTLIVFIENAYIWKRCPELTHLKTEPYRKKFHHYGVVSKFAFWSHFCFQNSRPNAKEKLHRATLSQGRSTRASLSSLIGPRSRARQDKRPLGSRDSLSYFPCCIVHTNKFFVQKLARQFLNKDTWQGNNCQISLYTRAKKNCQVKTWRKTCSCETGDWTQA